eukprot:TRINITY_DN29420_c0_g4_i1.p3 TRINITY_DN29420_c0_g4~~TRINITY_DN29420_c0_g4_i1.p3  ORF type:complete len:139 (-),score=24.33 TRINITY_DN29420_c0_g4_i1:56-472(-)
MWSYLQSAFVGSANQNQHSGVANNLLGGEQGQQGLEQVLHPAPNTHAQTRLRKSKDSYDALQKVLDGHKQQKKKRRGGKNGGHIQNGGGGLGLLLGEDAITPRSFYQGEDTAFMLEDEDSVVGHKQARGVLVACIMKV